MFIYRNNEKTLCDILFIIQNGCRFIKIIKIFSITFIVSVHSFLIDIHDFIELLKVSIISTELVIIYIKILKKVHDVLMKCSAMQQHYITPHITVYITNNKHLTT